MSELKNLKDMNLLFKDRLDLQKEFQKWAKENNVAEVPMSVIGWFAPKQTELLRQEAIKWVKDFQQINEEYRKLLVGSGETRMEKLDLFIDKCHEWFNKIDEKFPFLCRSCMTYNYETPGGNNHLRQKINCEIMYQGIRMTFFTLMHIFNIEDEDLK